MTTLASTELINAYGMSSANMDTFLNLLKAQNIGLFIIRLNSFNEWTSNSNTGIAFAKAMIAKANALGIDVAIDLHTWYTTWDNNFRDSAANAAANRAAYIQYVRNTLTAFDGVNVYAFMVLNEPQARAASGSENQFIIDVVNAAHEETAAPIGVRFMGGYSPTTGHYSSIITDAVDIVCRNSFWDARNPNAAVYGVTEQILLNAIDDAHAHGKMFWFTEFGTSKSNLENQRDYVQHMMEWAVANGVDAMFLWVSQPTSNSESYNIFSGYSPLPAFYELTGGESPPPEIQTWMLSLHFTGLGALSHANGEFQVTGNFTCTAYPDEGWVLARWEFDGENFGSNPTITVSQQEAGTSHVLNAVFTVYVPPEPVTPYACPWCDLAFETEPQLAAHIIAAHPDVVTVHSCPWCGMSFNTEPLLATHIRSVHPEVQPPPPDGHCFIATACGTSNPSLTVLRRVRDHRMHPRVVNLYYRLSPPLASAVSHRKTLKRIPRRLFEWLATRLKDVK